MKASILLLALLLSASMASAQRITVFKQTPPNTTPVIHHEFDIAKTQSDKSKSWAYRSQGADLARLRQDADELASLAQSIPPAVDQTTKGILPKDLEQKLKRIEKLSKQLRSGISR